MSPRKREMYNMFRIIDENQDIIELDCKHKFHKNCIMEWVNEYDYKCPICGKNRKTKISYQFVFTFFLMLLM